MCKPLTCLLLLFGLGAHASGVAEGYPDRPVRLIVPYPAGGQTDIISRLVGQGLASRLGQPVVIDNRSGAGGNIGTEALVRSKPDGYTVGYCGVSTAIAPGIYRSLSYDTAQDLVAVGGMTTGDNVLMVPAGSPTSSVQGLVALLRTKGSAANYGSAGVGASTHMATELFKAATHTQATHIPYKGSSPALTDLIAGRFDMMIDSIAPALPHIRAGTLRPLATTGPQRNASLMDVPTLREAGVDVEATSWTALCAPRGTPKEAVEALNAGLRRVLDDPAVRQRLAELGLSTLALTPSEAQHKLVTETERWKKIAADARIQAE